MGVFGTSPFADLDRPIMRQLVARCSVDLVSARAVYYVLVIHADCRGDVIARAGDIARHAGLDTEHARRLLRRLREAGHISKRPDRIGLSTVWHLTAIRDEDRAA